MTPKIWKILYANIRGLKGKRCSVIEHLHSEEPEMLLLTETLLQTNRDVKIDGYTFFGRARVGQKGGGVGILIRDDIKGRVIPHISERPIELIWVSIRRKNNDPLIIGCYYGRQETRCNKDEITEEMKLLSEEIEEYKKEGEVVVFMDGNGKIGLLGEEKSRNGKMLEEVFDQHNLLVMNRSSKCNGKVTRQNTKNPDEKSAIDFIVAEEIFENRIETMIVDENGLLKMKGEKDTDHNTIILTVRMEEDEKQRPIKKTKWRLNAPEQNWTKFRREMGKLENESKQIFTSPGNSLDQKYTKWIKNIESAARVSIGKTTIKARKKDQVSPILQEMRREKRQLKKILKRSETDQPDTLEQYKSIQEKIRNQILTEKTKKTNAQLNKMTQDKSRVIFWKERKKTMRNHANECVTVKDDSGQRQYDPEKIKETNANFFEKLYSKKPVRNHPHHSTVEEEILEFEKDKTYDQEWFNSLPTLKELSEVIEAKKHGKASTDLNNEIIKGTKDQFLKVFMPLIEKIWNEEQVPKEWNKGAITTIWKGKGDRECLDNHRGITVSSAIGSILEEVIDKRVEKIVKFSPGQAGGVRGASTSDHLFLLRGIMTTAQMDKKNLFITFYDVAKAYDRADVDNMLHVIWKAGLRGKIWRIMRNLSTNLTAIVKTRYGPSREIIRQNGGKQGSRIFGRLFSKQMDTLSEEFITDHEEKFKVNENFNIGSLEWIDDVATCTSGLRNQKRVLNIVDDFAKRNKLEWGQSKCQVMQVGRKTTTPEDWDLGEKKIKNTTWYKYLGDTITSDNKNKRNLEIKENKVESTIRQINTTASSDVMKGVESKVILTLYEKCITPSLTSNCESWNLSPGEEKQLDNVGIRALKRLFHLPTTTPNTSVIYSFGQLYMTQEIDRKRFMYLHKLLSREKDHWTTQMLYHLNTCNMGWAKNINEKLTRYDLETNWETIRSKTKGEWKRLVEKAVDKINKDKMIKSCVTEINGETKVNTKTKRIHEHLTTAGTYERRPPKEIISGTKQKTKTIILSRYGMLECGSNFKGTMSQICRSCGTTDNETHRLNECSIYRDTNRVNHHIKSNFEHIYSDDNDTLDSIIKDIDKVWEFRYANGRMKKVS